VRLPSTHIPTQSVTARWGCHPRTQLHSQAQHG